MIRLQKSFGSAAALAATLFSFNQSAPPKLDCTQRSQGVFWPLETNHDPRLLQTKAAAGDLWLCRGDYDWDAYFVQTTHFFKWKRVTVRVTRAKDFATADQLLRETISPIK